MSHQLFYWITTPLILVVWAYAGISLFKAHRKLMRTKGVFPMMTRYDMKDPAVKEAVRAWKIKRKNVFLLWAAACFAVLLASILIDRSIGFRD